MIESKVLLTQSLSAAELVLKSTSPTPISPTTRFSSLSEPEDSSSDDAEMMQHQLRELQNVLHQKEVENRRLHQVRLQ